jgi:hypothetical protein
MPFWRICICPPVFRATQDAAQELAHSLLLWKHFKFFQCSCEISPRVPCLSPNTWNLETLNIPSPLIFRRPTDLSSFQARALTTKASNLRPNLACLPFKLYTLAQYTNRPFLFMKPSPKLCCRRLLPQSRK